MTVGELKKELEKYDDNLEVRIVADFYSHITDVKEEKFKIMVNKNKIMLHFIALFGHCSK